MYVIEIGKEEQKKKIEEFSKLKEWHKSTDKKKFNKFRKK